MSIKSRIFSLFDGRRPAPHQRTCPQELPPTPRGAHYHVCATPQCWNHFTCYRGPSCPIPDHWTCPACEMDERDRWTERQATEGHRAH